jgi:hypothetical protein
METTMKGVGVAAARERIKQSFLSIHNDVRDRQQRQADQEMLAAILPLFPRRLQLPSQWMAAHLSGAQG